VSLGKKKDNEGGLDRKTWGSTKKRRRSTAGERVVIGREDILEKNGVGGKMSGGGTKKGKESFIKKFRT